MKKLAGLLALTFSLGGAACASAPSAKDGVPGASTGLGDFAGTWTGPWTEETTTGSKLEGTVELNVDKDGKVTGKMTNKTLSLEGTVSGAVVEGGATRADFVYPKATLNGEGRVGIKDGKLQGAVDVSQNGSKVGTLSFMLNRGS